VSPGRESAPISPFYEPVVAVPRRESILGTETGAVMISGVKDSNAIMFGFCLVID